METNPEIYLSRLRAMIEPRQQTWDLSPNDVEAISWVLESLAGQAAEIATLKTSLYVAEDRNNRGRDGWQIAKEANEAAQRYVKYLEEDNERLRQSTLTAELLEEVRYLLTRERDNAIDDGCEATAQRIDSALSKLPPAQQPGGTA